MIEAAKFLREAIFNEKSDASMQEAACNNLWAALAAEEGDKERPNA